MRERWDPRLGREPTSVGGRPGALRLTLDVDRAGVKTGDDGRVIVDERLRTSAEGVWSLGAHLLGPQAVTLVQPLVVALTTGMTAREPAEEPLWIHPALTEVVENALLELDLPAADAPEGDRDGRHGPGRRGERGAPGPVGGGPARGLPGRPLSAPPARSCRGAAWSPGGRAVSIGSVTPRRRRG
ncbi:hypothetical protein [Streptomyces sp. NPDC003717]|uniref:hypothetical protein n=1 Tax=Streptomyces sp. NPDC003717 TaxID=3154276 RepID=UPI0033A24B46